MNHIILCGFMGAGKSVVGRELAKITGRKFIDTDEMIEREQGMAIKAIFAARGEAYFRELEYTACQTIAGMKNCVISTGGGLLTFARNAAILQSSGTVVFLDADFETICARVGNTESRPLFQDKEQARLLFETRREQYMAVSDFSVDGNMSARKTALTIAQLTRK